APVGVLHHELPGVPEPFVPDVEWDAERTSSIARGWLHPDTVEDLLIEQPPVCDGIQRHAPRQAEVLFPGFRAAPRSHLLHELLGELLSARSEVLVGFGVHVVLAGARRTECLDEPM